MLFAIPKQKTIGGNLNLNSHIQAKPSVTPFPSEKVIKQPYVMLTAKDLENEDPMKWLIRGVLPAQGLASLYGASGTGKSFLTLDLAITIASGIDKWFGYRVIQAPVTYLCLEGEAGLKKRLKAWEIYHNESVPDSLKLVKQAFNLLSDDVKALADAVKSSGGDGGLIIIDTLNRASAGADENTSSAMGSILESAKKLAELTSCLILLVHHTGKKERNGPRGHSSYYAALDAGIEVSKNASGCSWSVDKSKDDVTGKHIQFKLEIVETGRSHEDGPITSCVAILDESVRAIEKKAVTLHKNQKLVFDAIQNALKTSSNINQEGVPAEKPSISFEEALALTFPLIPSKNKKEGATKAIKSLVEIKSVLGRHGDNLWIV